MGIINRQTKEEIEAEYSKFLHEVAFAYYESAENEKKEMIFLGGEESKQRFRNAYLEYLQDKSKEKT